MYLYILALLLISSANNIGAPPKVEANKRAYVDLKSYGLHNLEQNTAVAARWDSEPTDSLINKIYPPDLRAAEYVRVICDNAKAGFLRDCRITFASPDNPEIRDVALKLTNYYVLSRSTPPVIVDKNNPLLLSMRFSGNPDICPIEFCPATIPPPPPPQPVLAPKF
jgi:hypothetical protein